MAFVRKTWKDRISQYPNRRTITDENGVTKPVTVGRDEGEITEEGDGFTATNMNNLEQRIYSAFQQGGGGGGGGGSAADTTFDDTYVAFTADNVQTALEVITKSLTWAEYQSLTTEEKNNGTIYLITDVNGDMQIFQPVIYSEQEREIGVWTDGKPLYEKTVVVDNLTTGTNSFSILTGITIVKADGMFVSGTYMQPLFVGKLSSDNDCMCLNELNCSSGTARVTIGSSYSELLSGAYCSITLRYTKSTDTAGSGTWTPQGVPTVHYSTDEQIVGTWIDGKPLYEKTLKVGTVSSTSEQYFETNILSADVDTYFIKESFIITSTGLAWTTGGSNDGFFHILFLTNGTTNLRVSSRVSSNSMYGDLYVTLRYTKSST